MVERFTSRRTPPFGGGEMEGGVILHGAEVGAVGEVGEVVGAVGTVGDVGGGVGVSAVPPPPLPLSDGGNHVLEEAGAEKLRYMHHDE